MDQQLTRDEMLIELLRQFRDRTWREAEKSKKLRVSTLGMLDFLIAKIRQQQVERNFERAKMTGMFFHARERI